MTDADKVMIPQHFGRDLVDIRIQINPSIGIGIPDYFWGHFGLGRVCTLWMLLLLLLLLKKSDLGDCTTVTAGCDIVCRRARRHSC